MATTRRATRDYLRELHREYWSLRPEKRDRMTEEEYVEQELEKDEFTTYLLIGLIALVVIGGAIAVLPH